MLFSATATALAREEDSHNHYYTDLLLVQPTFPSVCAPPAVAAAVAAENHVVFV
jgi:hypothetical protein